MSIKLHVEGDYACFTRPEMKVERVSYDVMTPSAARGILEAIYWKPQISWVINAIRVLKPIRFTSVRRNEVSQVIPAGSVRTAMKSGVGMLAQYIEDDRQQRAGLLLRDVSYIIEATIVVRDPHDVTGKLLSCPEAKHLDTFNRRARDGRAFMQPYFGCREFPVRFTLLEEGVPEPADALPTEERNRELGYMLHDLDYKQGMSPRFFRAKLEDGLLRVPEWKEALS
jgi:CRISPR-associated protein Cas5d